MKRRTWLIGGTAALGGAAGLGWQRWREHQEAALHAATGGVWTLRFPRPDGGELVLAERRGAPLLLNFWATWCPPCVREMPALDRVHREFAPRGLTVVGLAIDGPTPVREFLTRSPVGYAIGLAGFEGTELTRRLGNDRGALPFSVLFGADGTIVQRKLGEASEADLRAWARSVV
jgi:thiol-disulfide isomerase/thioredoxin